MGARVSSGPGSFQAYATPPEFIAAVERRFGPIDFDLAASAENAKAARYFTEEQDALVQSWGGLGTHMWLNPPFAGIAPWAEKCAGTILWGAHLSFLVPAAVGSNWFRDFVDGRARVYFLNGRLCFDGKSPYPKDCILVRYNDPPGYEVWTWRSQ